MPVSKKPTLPVPQLPLAAAPARIFAGTSGWSYPTWRPGFYPEKLSPKKFLGFYASQLNSCEVNYTFRKLPESAKLTEWLAQVPPGFRFSFKAPQRITHFSRLRECSPHVEELLQFVEPAAAAEKLGLLLFQLPPNLKADLPRLRDFLQLPSLLKARIAFEFRHESWFADETENLLEAHGAALCIAETEEFRSPQWHTAPAFTSFRMRHSGGYTARQIDSLAMQMLELARTREVYVYFKHEDSPTGALNGAALLRSALQKAVG